METEMIKLETRGLDKVNAYLKSLPRGTLRAALAAFSLYLIGNDQRGLKHYPARVEHGPGNPYQWQSEKQRRAYFATNGFGGGIPYRRTGTLKNSWEVKETRGGYQNQIVNTSPYSQFVQGDDQQRGHAADKWRQYGEIIKTNMAGAMRAAQQAANRWLKSKK